MIFAISIACTITERIAEIGEDIESVATSIEVGDELLETGQAMVTDIDLEEIEKTAEAIATEVEIPELSGEKPDDIPVL